MDTLNHIPGLVDVKRLSQEQELWDHFAAHALAGARANPKYNGVPTSVYAQDASEMADAMLAERKRRLNQPSESDIQIKSLQVKVEMLEAMRPHWAKGYTSDSIAAQTTVAALNSLWELLRARDQTDAVARLQRLIEGLRALTRPVPQEGESGFVAGWDAGQRSMAKQAREVLSALGLLYDAT